MDKKTVWLVSHYAMPPHLEVRIKTLMYAKILQERGYKVILITASTIHNNDINLIEDKSLYIEKEYEGLKFIHIRCSNYKGSGLKRIVNLYQFQSRFNNVMKHFELPDIIVADVNCINYRGILKFAKKNKVPFVSEIRDLWPLSIVEYKNISEKNPIIKYLYLQEKRMYKLSDALIFSMEGGRQYIIDKKWQNKVNLDKIFNINNGIDTALQEKQKKEFTVEDEDLSSDKFKVVYTGSIREANSVDKIVKAAEILKNQKDIQFLIYGDGDLKKELEEYCLKNKLENIKFKGRVKKEYLPFIISKCSLCILTYKNVQAWKYGGSQNKLFDYMISGKPVVSNIKMNYSLIERYKCGIEIGSDNPEDISKSIKQIYELPKEEYNQMCINAQNGAKDFDFEKLTDKFEQVINYACSCKNKKEGGKTMEFIDLKKQYKFLKSDIDKGIKKVLKRGDFISGKEVKELTSSLCEYVGSKYCVTCANGTDALTIALRCLEVGKGDAVFVPDFTFFATAETPALEGAECIFVDVDERTFNIDPEKLDNAIKRVTKEGKLKPKCVITVDLFGLPANYPEIKKVTEKYSLKIIEDGAQGFGGAINGKRACSFGDISTTSFFPAKPLGCYGDGGAIFTDSEEYYKLASSLAVHGKGSFKYDNVRIGYNSRLDTVQAAVLKVKLEAFKKYELQKRQEIAKMYSEKLNGKFKVPVIPEGFTSSFAQFTLIAETEEQRNDIIAKLKEHKIPAMIYYPIPMHLQTAFKNTPFKEEELEVSTKLCKTVFSIPMHPYLKKSDVDKIVNAFYNINKKD